MESSAEAGTGTKAGASGGRSRGARYGVLAAKVALTALVAWFVLRSVDAQLSEIGAIEWGSVQVDVPLLLASIAVLFGELALAAWLWAKLVTRLGGPRVSVPTAAAILVLANFGRYVPGKVLHIVGLAVLADRARCPVPVATAASILAQLLNLGAAALVGGWVLLQMSGASSLAAGALAVAVLALLAVLARHGRVQQALAWTLRRLNRRRTPDGELDAHTHPESAADTQFDAQSVAGLAPLGWLAAFVAKWFVYGLAFFLLAKSMGADGSFLFYSTIFACAYLVGYIAVLAPAGIGVREATLVAMMEPALGAEASIVLAVAQRAWVTAFELITAPGSVAVFWRRTRRG